MFRIVIALAIVIVAAACSQPTPQADSPTAAVSTPADSMPGMPAQPPTTDDALIASAMSAAPHAVAADATIITMDEAGTLRTVRQGTSQFTCMPDMPQTPGPDPMCVDQNGLDWAMAWMAHKDPPTGKIGFGYMLGGGSDASNSDPYATAPPAGGAWVTTPPHVMVFNTKGVMDGYPTDAGDTTKPYVMWAGTPYEHLMIPVQ